MKGWGGYQSSPTKNYKKGYYNDSPTKKTDDKKTDDKKEQLLNQGFTQADADKMIADGAVTGVVTGGAMKGNKSKKKTNKPPVVEQDFVPAYPGADISKAEYDKAVKDGVTSEAEFAAWKSKNIKRKGKKSSPTKWVQAVAALAPVVMEMMKKKEDK